MANRLRAISANTEREFLIKYLQAELRVPGEHKTENLNAMSQERNKIKQTSERITSVKRSIEHWEGS